MKQKSIQHRHYIQRFLNSNNLMIKKRNTYIAEIVYGGMDGTVTTFAVIAGAMGGILGGKIVLILGFANIFADGISMAIGDFLSNKAEMAQGIGSHKKAIHGAIATFIAFVVFGSIPILPYVAQVIYPSIAQTEVFVASCILTMITFIIIGWAKADITKTSRSIAIGQTLGLGTVAALLAYGVGSFLEKIIQ